MLTQRKYRKKNNVLTSKAIGIETYKNKYVILQYFKKTFPLRLVIKSKNETKIITRQR